MHHRVNVKSMNHDDIDSDDMRPEYDFSDAEQGRHYQAYRRGTNVVLLDPDVAKVFKSSQEVNEALRALMKLAKDQVGAGSA